MIQIYVILRVCTHITYMDDCMYTDFLSSLEKASERPQRQDGWILKLTKLCDSQQSPKHQDATSVLRFNDGYAAQYHQMYKP